MVGIGSFGAYVPLYRLGRQEMGQTWGIPAVPGERAVANGDEDSITMGVEAALECLEGVDPASIDGVYFATTTSPYAEKQGAALIASTLDLRKNVFTADFTDSIRSATEALRAAFDAVQGGSAKNVLVVAADSRPAEPETMWEQILGDGAGAVLVSEDGPAAIRGFQSVTSEVLGPWRRSGDPYVRSFEPKLETQYGYIPSMAQAAKAVLASEKLEPKDLAKAILYAGDPRSHQGLARALGLEMPQLQDTFFFMLGNVGTPQVLMMLAAALEAGKAGDKLLVANYGDGADAFLIEVKEPLAAPPGRRSISSYLGSKQALSGYGSYAAKRQLMERDRFVPKSSPVTYWRDARMELALYGARCKQCGTVQYPTPRVCVKCATKDELEEVKLPKKGTVFTYTLDHLVGADYLNTPVPRIVADLEDGCRIFLEMTDCDPTKVEVGMPVELTFRRLHEGAEFHNYFWKCRPLRAAA